MASPSCGVVIFNYAEWVVQYPEFGAVSSTIAQSYFDRACLSVDNTPQSVIQNLFERTILLNLATCHVAVLAGALNSSQRQTVGRVSSANQGSVSVSLDMPVKGGAMAVWWNQTSYGAQYYAATLKYRTAVYNPPARGIGPTLPVFGRYGRGW